ncbi:class I SAM-dependent methyltransferase [Acidiphilium sp. AL]|uniref:class I SAM-dependent methyltransferase n=1 Tax=Acidiphilium sp. AL TaxID=2871704 RepID=UPI0021CB308F|nr:class I SAM-dependent methyltransferase [Acidiphilium sp. AL]
MSGNDRQIAYWNEVAGPKWIRMQEAMEARLAAIETLLLERASPQRGETVLEVGCGTGATTARLAALVGERGHVTAADVSRPMLDAARTRLAGRENVTLIEADAATADFGTSFDLIASRFGVMFFEDPAAAFAHLHASLRPGGRLCCVAWAPLDANPHWAIPLAIAIGRLGAGRPRPPHAPGPLAFDDPAYVEDILRRAGFAAISVTAEPATILGRSLDDEAEIAAFMGPAGRLLDEKAADAATRAELRAAFRAALPGYADPNACLRATVHVIMARRGG